MADDIQLKLVEQVEQAKRELTLIDKDLVKLSRKVAIATFLTGFVITSTLGFGLWMLIRVNAISRTELVGVLGGVIGVILSLLTIIIQINHLTRRDRIVLTRSGKKFEVNLKNLDTDALAKLDDFVTNAKGGSDAS